MNPADEPQTGIYWGRIMHHRFSPKRNYFTYPVFIFAIDLDEIEALNKRLRLFGHNRFSLYTLRNSDHAYSPGNADSATSDRSIKEHVMALLRERGYEGSVDRVFMVTQFRILGYLFNPVTFYYCYADGKEVAYVAEVNNTFHQRHSYVFFGGQRSFLAEKVFYVSPFLEMDLSYHFRFEPLKRDWAVYVDDYKAGKAVLKTHIAGKLRPFSDWELLKSFLRIPWMSVWIIAWIHWQALRLWIKMVPGAFRPHDGMKPGWTAASENPSQPTQVSQASEAYLEYP
jgi:hypothetical protein